MEPGKDLGRASQRYLCPARQLLQRCCCCFHARRNQYEVRVEALCQLKKAHIDTAIRDLKEVPQLLRVRLEAAINEEASAATLHEHLPKIRPIILDLLRGLREKQDQHHLVQCLQKKT